MHKLICSLIVVSLSTADATAQTAPADSSHTLIVPLLSGKAVVEKVLGDPSKAGEPYVIRIQNDDNFFVLPHTHPNDEHVVVVKGTWHLGSGPRFDRSKLRPLATGDFVRIRAAMPHFAWSEGETIIQVHGIGPFRLDFVDKAYRLGNAARDSTVLQHFKFRVKDNVSFEGGQGAVVDGMASPANNIIQYLILSTDGRQLVKEERTLRTTR